VFLAAICKHSVIESMLEMDKIPESYLRYCAFASALLCWALYGDIFIACGGCVLWIVSGLFPKPELIGLNTASMIIGAFLILLVT
jgi:hypothetical protein